MARPPYSSPGFVRGAISRHYGIGTSRQRAMPAAMGRVHSMIGKWQKSVRVPIDFSPRVRELMGKRRGFTPIPRGGVQRGLQGRRTAQADPGLRVTGRPPPDVAKEGPVVFGGEFIGGGGGEAPQGGSPPEAPPSQDVEDMGEGVDAPSSLMKKKRSWWPEEE